MNNENIGALGARLEIEPMRTYDYNLVRAGGSEEVNYPQEFIISPNHRGVLKNQGHISACVGCVMSSLAEVFDIIEQEKANQTIEDLEFSEGWAYGALRKDTDTQMGMFVSDALEQWSKKGMVPKKYFDILEEMPKMQKYTKSVSGLDKIAIPYKIKGYASLMSEDDKKTDLAIKKALYENDYGVLGVSYRYFLGGSHCITIVGWNDKTNSYKIKNSWGKNWGDKEGIGEIPKNQINCAYVIIDEVIEPNFEDVDKTKWYYKNVKNMYLSGIMNGTTSTLFEPEKNITRAELSTVLTRLVQLTNDRLKILIELLTKDAKTKLIPDNQLSQYLNVPSQESESLTFGDVSKEDWFYENVKYVYDLGIMKGKELDKFYPNDSVSRAEIATVISRLYNLIIDKLKKILIKLSKYNSNIVILLNNYKLSPTHKNCFADINKEDWFYEAVALLNQLGIINGVTPNDFEPNRNLTRAEASAIFDRTTKSIDSLIQKTVS